jgi:hypothetical protein
MTAEGSETEKMNKLYCVCCSIKSFVFWTWKVEIVDGDSRRDSSFDTNSKNVTTSCGPIENRLAVFGGGLLGVFQIPSSCSERWLIGAFQYVYMLFSVPVAVILEIAICRDHCCVPPLPPRAPPLPTCSSRNDGMSG